MTFDALSFAGTWHAAVFGGLSASVEDLSARMARAGICEGLVTTTDAGDNAGLVAALSAPREGPRLHFMAWVDPMAPDIEDLIEDEPGRVAALFVHGPLIGMKASDPSLKPFVIYCGRSSERAGPEPALRVAQQFPQVPVILTQLGGDHPRHLDRALEIIAEERLERAHLATDGLRHPWLLRRAVERLGPERIIFGSGAPLHSPEAILQQVGELGLPGAQLAAICGGNLRRLLA